MTVLERLRNNVAYVPASSEVWQFGRAFSRASARDDLQNASADIAGTRPKLDPLLPKLGRVRSDPVDPGRIPNKFDQHWAELESESVSFVQISADFRQSWPDSANNDQHRVCCQVDRVLANLCLIWLGVDRTRLKVGRAKLPNFFARLLLSFSQIVAISTAFR